MQAGNFNYHQILFTLDTIKKDEEKLTYLNEIGSQIDKIITSFEAPKLFPLNVYALKDLDIEENCRELHDFISKQFSYSSNSERNSHRRKYPGESELKGLLRKEILNYKKLSMIVNEEINNLSRFTKTPNNEFFNDQFFDEFILPIKTTPKYITNLLISSKAKIIWNKSIGELIDLIKIIIVLELHPKIENNGIIDLICDRFVDRNKEPYSNMHVVKTHNMLENTFWQNSRTLTPKYLQ